MAENKMRMQPEKIMSNRSLGAILLDSGKLSAADVERILKLQKNESIRFGDAGIKLGLLSLADVQHALASQYDYPYLAEGSDTVSDKLVAAYNPFGEQAESLRTLRTLLMLKNFTGQPNKKRLAIVSPNREEGRSFLAANLAIVFSQLGERTLLIDADLRNPSQHELFKLNNDHGLSTILAGRDDVQAIQRKKNFTDLSILTAGPTPPNPQELLGKPAFFDLLKNLSEVFDVILLDTSPSAEFADAQMVSVRAGSAMMLARKNFSSIEQVSQQVKKMTQSGIEMVGTTLSEFRAT
jgi:protein-tyrosine kinase